MFVAALDRLVLRLCRQNYGAWAQVTISEPAVENGASAPAQMIKFQSKQNIIVSRVKNVENALTRTRL